MTPKPSSETDTTGTVDYPTFHVGRDLVTASLEQQLAAARGEVKRLRTICEQGRGRCENFMRGLLAADGKGGPVFVMIHAISQDFDEALTGAPAEGGGT